MNVDVGRVTEPSTGNPHTIKILVRYKNVAAS